MAESATNETTLEQILWRAMSRFPERPALVDAEELEQRLGWAPHDAEVPAESWVERFFAGDRLHAPDDVAGAVVQATRGQLHVYEFDLGQLEYVIVEDAEDVVVVSEFGQFALPNDGSVPRAIAAAALPANAPPGAPAEPRAYFVRSSGEVLALDAAQVARALDGVRLQQVSLPAVERPRARLSRLFPVRETSVPLTREARAPWQEGPSGPETASSGAEGAPPFRPQIGAASRWAEMLSLDGAQIAAGAAPFEASASLEAQAPLGATPQRFIVEGDRVAVVIRPRAGQAAGAAGIGAPAGVAGIGAPAGAAGIGALAAAEALAAVREGSMPVRLLRGSELRRALAHGGWVARAPGTGGRFWVQPEGDFRPGSIEQLLPLPPPPGLLSGSPPVDWVWVEPREAGQAAPQEPLGLPGGEPVIAAVPQGVTTPGAPLLASAAANAMVSGGSVIVDPGLGAHRLPFGLPAVAPRTGALPRTTLSSLHFALERTGAAAAFRIPPARIALAGEHQAPEHLDLPSPARPEIAGQVARLVHSLPFPDEGGLHVGPDLGHALQVFLAAPVAPALAAAERRELQLAELSQEWVAAGRPAPAARGEWVPTLPNPGAIASPERWVPTLPGTGEAPRGEPRAAVSGELAEAEKGAPSLLSRAAALSGLPLLLLRALRRGGEWVPGPGAPLPAAVHAVELELPLVDEPELARPSRRPLNPGEEEIVIPQPLWARMDRRPAQEELELSLPLPAWSTPSVFDGVVRERSIDLPLPPPASGFVAPETVLSEAKLPPIGRSSVVRELTHAPPLDLPLPATAGFAVREIEEVVARPARERPPDPAERHVVFGSERTRAGLSAAVPAGAPEEIGAWRRSDDGPEEMPGDAALGLSRTVRSASPSVLRFRYPGAPLWWSSATPAAELSVTSVVETFTPWRSPLASTVEFHSGERVESTSAALWRSIFVVTPEAARSIAESWSLDQAEPPSGLSRHVEALAGPAALGPAALVRAAQPAREAVSGPVYVAMTGQGLPGLTGSPAARAKAEAVEMDIVEAVPPPPPAIESMGGAGRAIEPPGTRARSAPAESASAAGDAATDSVSTSKLEGSVDAIAQRIYHRIRRRIESDRERFGG
jgi:hypothetical protein